MKKLVIRFLPVIPPLLFSLAPPLAMLANNVNDVTFADASRAILVSAAGALLLFGLLRLVIRDWSRASLVLSAVLVLFFSYGHVFDLLKDRKFAGLPLDRHSLLLPVAGVLLAVWVWWVVSRLREPGVAVKALSLVSLFLLIFPTYTLLSHDVKTARLNSLSLPGQTNRQAAAANTLPATGSLPDIYYIILDGYGRADILSELYSYDNSGFMNFLKARGFYVAESSHSNYNQTGLSLSSSLNMSYLDDLAAKMGPGPTQDRSPMNEKVQESSVIQFLRDHGYKILIMESGYLLTQYNHPDVFWSMKDGQAPPDTRLRQINAFETMLIESTALRPVLDAGVAQQGFLRKVVLDPEYQTQRERILYAFSRLPDVANLDGQYFVFAHILAPHPPFVFGQHGELPPLNRVYRLGDGSHYEGTRAEYIEDYRNQLIFITTQIEGTIDRILARSKQTPIIIIQGDHGPGAYLDWESAQNSNLHERLSILNAYLFPGGEADLYPTITPVNSFRVLFDHYFSANLPLLEDKSFFSTWSSPYDFIDVTDQLKGP